MSKLFPVMWADHGTLWLSGDCSVSESAMRSLALANITELKMDDCLPAPDVLHQLVHFGSLESLAVFSESYSIQGSLSLEPLYGNPVTGPQLQLTKLRLECLIDLTGLDVVLAQNPLRELLLGGVYFPPSLTPTMHLASPTLRVMHLNPNLTYPTISAANFPALHTLKIDCIDLKEIPGMDAETSVQRVKCLATFFLCASHG